MTVVFQLCKIHGMTEHSSDKSARKRCRKCMYEAVKKRRAKVKKMAVDYKGGKCEFCGYNKCIGALEFHHMDPLQKDFSISSNNHNKSWSSVVLELDKCLLLCANCHREEHEKMNLGV